jgi:GNAT superfamily N-acetyltransferase
LTDPFEYVRLGEIGVMRDAAGRKEPRTTEILAVGAQVEAIGQLVKSEKLGRYVVCAIHDGVKRDLAMEAAYKDAGYRLMRTEPFFVRDLGKPVPPVRRETVRRVTTADDFETVTRANRRRLIDGQEIEREAPTMRLFAAFEGVAPVGWVASLDSMHDSTWVSSLLVREDFRRKGIASDLMHCMLADDAMRGRLFSVLLASHAGAQLYPRLGYEQVGLLEMFCLR